MPLFLGGYVDQKNFVFPGLEVLHWKTVRVEDASFVSGVVVCCRYHWESRHQEGDGIAQAGHAGSHGHNLLWQKNGTMMYRWHGVPGMVIPAKVRWWYRKISHVQFCHGKRLGKCF